MEPQMPVQSVNGFPCRFSAGDSLNFSIAFSGYLSTAGYGLMLVLNKGGAVGLTIYGTPNADGSFQITQTEEQTWNMAPGRYQWAAFATTSTSRKLVGRGQASVLPNFAVAANPTTAQTLLDECEAALSTILTSGKSSVSFNGQSFTRTQLSELRTIRNELRAQVDAELRAAGYAPQAGSKTIVTQFA